MEPIKPQQDRTSDQPMRPRPVMNDFVVRTRPAVDGVISPRPANPIHPAPTPASPQPVTTTSTTPSTALRPSQPITTPPDAAPADRVSPTADQKQPVGDLELEEHQSNAPRPRSTTGRAGLVGFAVFAVLFSLLLSPLFPGKVLENFPGSSATLSSGDQTLACLQQLENINTAQRYDSKLGAPIVYKYAQSTTQTATCSGVPQSAIVAHSSQFNPLGLAIDFVLALVVAVGVSKLWKKLFGEKHHY